VVWEGILYLLFMVEDTQKRSQAALRVSMMKRLGLASRALAVLLNTLKPSAALLSPSLTPRRSLRRGMSS